MGLINFIRTKFRQEKIIPVHMPPLTLYEKLVSYVYSIFPNSWPVWAITTIFILSLLCILLIGLQILINYINSIKSKRDSENKIVNNNDIKVTIEFRIFQLQYLSVYLTIMLADWLQGTNMYTLYKSYGVDVGTLFLTGFLSSAIFGTFLGIYVDKWGRKFGCIIFCILEIIINTLEHVQSMPVLLIGRVLGGLSTSLLFSAFESWMVSEHRNRGFHENLLTSTFSLSSSGNGLVAIFAGMLAQVAFDLRGDIGPFQLAIVLSAISMMFIFTWNENKGNVDDNVGTIINSIKLSKDTITANPSMLYLGLSQSFFEGAIYSFVFMWVPSLILAYNDIDTKDSLPFGLIFSCFMLSMSTGGILFGILLPIFPSGAEGLTIFVYITAAISMIIPIIKFEFYYLLVSFLVLEAMVGMFNSSGATLRSKYYPESMQSSIMSVFRIPLNLLVVLGTKLTDNASDKDSLKFVFGVTWLYTYSVRQVSKAITSISSILASAQ
jgi:MFS family permease